METATALLPSEQSSEQSLQRDRDSSNDEGNFVGCVLDPELFQRAVEMRNSTGVPFSFIIRKAFQKWVEDE